MENVTVDEARNIVESLLFVAKKPVSEREIHETTELSPDRISSAISTIESEYSTRGLQVLKLANGYVLATRPRYSPFIERFLNSPVSVTLSHQALEALSIIAYRQPVTKVEVENIRGVLCDGVIDTLLEKKLIKESGRSEAVGRPILYSTTVEFLKHFGLHDLGDLPPLPEGSEAAALAEPVEAADVVSGN